MLEHDEEMLQRNVIRVQLAAKLETALNHLRGDNLVLDDSLFDILSTSFTTNLLMLTRLLLSIRTVSLSESNK